MKKLVWIALAVYSIAAPLRAQETEQETLLSGDIEHGGYGGPVVMAGPVRNETGVFIGGYGGWFINHTFMIGGGGYGLVSNITAGEEALKIDSLTPSVGFGYGGLVLEFTGNSNSLVHYTVHTLIGAGGAGHYLRRTGNDEPFDDIRTDGDDWESCFVGEVGAAVELNVASFVRLGVGGSYLFVNGVELPGLNDSDLSGPRGFVRLKFGKF